MDKIKEFFLKRKADLKFMKIGDIVAVIAEFIFFIVGFIFSINFFYNLSHNIPFIGEGYKGYEIGITIFLFILTLFDLFVVVFSLLFHSYENEYKDVKKKIVKNGRVIEVEEDTSKN